MTLAEMRETLQRRLGDSTGDIWASSEIDALIQEGYDELCRRTGCLWATDTLPDTPAFMAVSQEWELDYLEAGMRGGDWANFTYEWERDYIEQGRGPANHTAPWEYDDDYVVTLTIPATVPLPEDCYEIERATWNGRRLASLRSRDLENCDERYELNTGQVEGFLTDKDGMNMLRKYRVPSSAYDHYEMDDAAEVWGILRDVNDLTDEVPVEHWGDITGLENHVCTDQWGIVRRIHRETLAVRIEYRRRPLALASNQDFELPDRYTVYVRHYAQARALEREGPGQDIELAGHYQQRYETGVTLMLKRRSAVHYQKLSVMGGGPRKSSRPPIGHLPAHYPALRLR